MKFSLDAVKNADWKQLAIDHGEKAGFAAALLLAAAVLLWGRWTPYAETQPAGVDRQVDLARQDLKRSVWTDEKRAEDVPPMNVRERAEALLVKEDIHKYDLPHAFRAPLVAGGSAATEPKWLAPEDVLVDVETLLVRLTPSDEAEADEEEEADETEPEDDIPDEFRIAGPGGATGRGDLPSGFGGFDGGGRGPGGMDESGGSGSYDEGFDSSGFGDESVDGGRGPGGFGGGRSGRAGATKIDETARGRGVKVAAVRAVFPYRRQVQELAKALGNIPYSQAEARLEFLELQVERQRAIPGDNPWAGPWAAVDRQAAEDLLAEDAGATREFVPVNITDPAITFPLLSRVYGFFDADRGKGTGTHPRISGFDLSKEAQAYQEQILEKYRARTEEANARRAAEADRGTRKRAFGRDKFDAGDAAAQLAGGDAEDKALLEQLNEVMVENVLMLVRFFDVAVEPGQMYRYRVRLALKNPNFGYGMADVEDPAALTGEERLTPWSDPSAPVVVQDDEFAFLTDARAGEGGAAPAARLEVTQYSREFGTYVRDKTSDLHAGDLLTFEDGRAFVIDPVKGAYSKKQAYVFDTDQVVLDVFAPPADAADLHPDLKLGGRDTPAGRVLLLAGTGAVTTVDATDAVRKVKLNEFVDRMQTGLTASLTDRDAVSVPSDDDYGFGEGGFGEESGGSAAAGPAAAAAAVAAAVAAAAASTDRESGGCRPAAAAPPAQRSGRSSATRKNDPAAHASPPGPASRFAAAQAAAGSGSHRTAGGAGEPAVRDRARAARSAAGVARGFWRNAVSVTASNRPSSGRSTPAASLSRATASTAVRFAGGAGRGRSSRAAARAAAPAGLWATSNSTAGPAGSPAAFVGAGSSSVRPGSRVAPTPAAKWAGVTGNPAARATSSRWAATARFARWCRPPAGAGSGPHSPPGQATASVPSGFSRTPSGNRASISGAPAARQAAATASAASPGPPPQTSGTPGLATPAFSRAIAAGVSPRIAVWSSEMFVTAQATGRQTFVASSRPPRPTSSTAIPQPVRAKCRNPQAVTHSKNVAAGAPPRSARSAAASTSRARAANAAAPGSAPSTVNRSSTRYRCGEVNRPVRIPAAVSAAAVKWAVDPFPFVPAIWRAGTARCGSPSSASTARTPSN